jgi:hypothetical protein
VPDSFHVYIDDFFFKSGFKLAVFAVNPFSSSGEFVQEVEPGTLP